MKFKSLNQRRIKKDCAFIGAATNIGQPLEGTEFAASWLRTKSLLNDLEDKFDEINDLGNIATQFYKENKDTFERMKILSNMALRLSHTIERSVKANTFPITIGGDHSISTGTLAGYLNYDNDLKVIWVDAHPDINTLETSPSHNLHGMPVALAMGLFNNEEIKRSFSFIPKLRPENIVYIGLRDIDPGEKKMIERLGIKYFTNSDVHNFGIEDILNRSVKHLQSSENADNNFYLSIDIDGIDPKFFPTTGTPVDNGITLQDGKYIIEHLCQKTNLLGMDIVEINPLLGTKQELNTTLNSIRSLIEAIPSYNEMQNLYCESQLNPVALNTMDITN